MAPPKTTDARPRRGRPKCPPELSDARRKLIKAGLLQLTEKGYSSVGVEEILKSAGVPKGSFYHHFRNKADFGSQLIDAYHTYFREKLDQAFADTNLPALDRLRAFIRDAERGMQRHHFRRGCLVGNLGQEMGALPDEFREQLQRVLKDWQARTAACLRLAQAQGELDAEQDPDALAEFFWIGWEGAVMRAKLERRAHPLRSFANTFFRLVNPLREKR